MSQSSAPTIVIARLDRAIHATVETMGSDTAQAIPLSGGSMDCPVKPGNDGGGNGADRITTATAVAPGVPGRSQAHGAPAREDEKTNAAVQRPRRITRAEGAAA